MALGSLPSLVVRAYDRAVEQMTSVRASISIGVLAVLLVAAFERALVNVLHYEWLATAVILVAAALVVLGLSVVYYLIRIGTRRARNDAWEAHCSLSGTEMYFQLDSTRPYPSLNPVACIVRDPHGLKSRAEEGAMGGSRSRLFAFPRQFAGASPVALSGRYDVLWQLRNDRGKWREVLLDSFNVDQSVPGVQASLAR